jgi:hypothetical protein
VLGRPIEEPSAERREPGNVVALALLLEEESRQEQTLRSGRLHDLGVGVSARVEHEHVEDRAESGRARRKLVTRRGRRGREVRKDAGVVQEFVGRHVVVFGHVLQALEEEPQRL